MRRIRHWIQNMKPVSPGKIISRGNVSAAPVMIAVAVLP